MNRGAVNKNMFSRNNKLLDNNTIEKNKNISY